MEMGLSESGYACVSTSCNAGLLSGSRSDASLLLYHKKNTSTNNLEELYLDMYKVLIIEKK